MSAMKVPHGCKSIPAIEQVLKYPVETRKLSDAVKEYFDLLRMDKELSSRDPNMHKYIVERHSLRKEFNPIKHSEEHRVSILYRLLNESFIKYGMQIQRSALEEYILLHDIKDHYIKLVRGPPEFNSTTDSSTVSQGIHTRQEYFSPRSKISSRDASNSTTGSKFHISEGNSKEVPNGPIRINGVIYYPQPMYQESNIKVTAQNELVTRLQGEVEECNKVIDDLRDRISESASRKIQDGGPNVLYTDKNTPTRLAEDFHNIFHTEWPAALKALSLNKKSFGVKDEEEGISLLMNIVQNGYEFCCQSAAEQLQKLSFCLERGFEDPFVSLLDLRHINYDQRKRIPDFLIKELKQLRKAENTKSIMHATQRFKDGDLLRNPKYNYRHSTEMEAFVNAVIETTWLMTIQDPPMELKWPRPNDRFNETFYQPFIKQGNFVKFAVWPAVFLHEKGPLIKKGYAQPI